MRGFAGSREHNGLWVARHATTILFSDILLCIGGIYLAGKVPISVFPETNGGLLVSMVLSLLVTPVVFFRLTRDKASDGDI